jgi:hypothetical protein
LEVERSLLKRWVALYAIAMVCRRGEREKHTRSLTLPYRAGPGVAWRGVARQGITGRCNPRRVFHINTYDRHKMSTNEPPRHLGFHLIRCCVAKATSPRSLTCICDWESRSLEPSSSTILHLERAHMVFGKQSL